MINAIEMGANGTATLACDSADDVLNLPDFAEDNNLKLGTTCICAANGKVYIMQSDFTFVEI